MVRRRQRWAGAIVLALAAGCGDATGPPTDWYDVPTAVAPAPDAADCLAFTDEVFEVGDVDTGRDQPPGRVEIGVRNRCHVAIGQVNLYGMPGGAISDTRIGANQTSRFEAVASNVRTRGEFELPLALFHRSTPIDEATVSGRVVGPEVRGVPHYRVVLTGPRACVQSGQLTLANLGERAAEITRIDLDGPERIEADLPESLPMVLDVGEELDVPVTFHPAEVPGEDTAVLTMDYGVHTGKRTVVGSIEGRTLPRGATLSSTVLVAAGGTAWAPVDLDPTARVLRVFVDGDAWPEDRWSLDAHRAHVIVQDIADGRRDITIEQEAPCPG